MLVRRASAHLPVTPSSGPACLLVLRTAAGGIMPVGHGEVMQSVRTRYGKVMCEDMSPSGIAIGKKEHCVLVMAPIVSLA